MDPARLKVNTSELIGPKLALLRSRAVIMLALGAVLTGVGFVLDYRKAFEAYHFAYLFWFGVTVGSLGLLMLHHTVGGGWGFVIRRFLEAGSRLLPVAALMLLPLLIPVFMGGTVKTLWAGEIWPVEKDAHAHAHPGWANPESSHDAIVQAKAAFLNPWTFLLVALICFGLWMLWSSRLNSLGAVLNERNDQNVVNQLNYWGAGGLVLYVVTMTFVGVHWVMSLDPHWFSSIFPLLMVASQALSTLALFVLLLSYLASETDLLGEIPPNAVRDLGNLMLALTMLWAYMSFSQYLIIYSGNLTEEIQWYLRRANASWGWISLLLIPVHFILPFGILLVSALKPRNWKLDPRNLSKVAAWILFARFLDLLWWTKPNFNRTFLEALSPADLGAPLLLGGIWLFLWSRQVEGRTVVPAHDPRLTAHLHEVAGHG